MLIFHSLTFIKAIYLHPFQLATDSFCQFNKYNPLPSRKLIQILPQTLLLFRYNTTTRPSCEQYFVP